MKTTLCGERSCAYWLEIALYLRFEEQLRQRHDAEMLRLQAEEEKVMDIEREAQEARLKEKQVETHPHLAVAYFLAQRLNHKVGLDQVLCVLRRLFVGRPGGR